MVDLNKLCLISYFIIFAISQEGMSRKILMVMIVMIYVLNYNDSLHFRQLI